MKYEIKRFDENSNLKNTMIFDSEQDCIDWYNDYLQRKNINLENSTYTITDVTAREEIKEKVETAKSVGQLRKQCCEDILNYVTGHNVVNDLTTEQIDQMQAQYSDALSALNSNRVDIAKALIQAGEPDGVITTQELKDGCLQIFEQYGI